MRLAPDDIFSLAGAARSSASVAPRLGVMHNRVRVRRGGRARFKAHAWNACRLERVSGVRIPPSPPYSLACFPTFWRSDEIGAWGAIHARPWTRRMPTTASERKDRSKFSVCDFGMSICEPADILRGSVLGKNA